MLSTKDLNKRFSSLSVAQDIALELPAGVRYALIGPNGAGKTTLINLLTGLLAPDAGEIFLAGRDISALRPEVRVRAGLARTFQINTLFAGLTPLESVAIAVLEREGHAHNWWRALPAFGATAWTASTSRVSSPYQPLASHSPLKRWGFCTSWLNWLPEKPESPWRVA